MTTVSHVATPLEVLSPVRGVLSPLDEVPDPTMRSRTLGDGVAIEPLSERVVAPFDGVVSFLARTQHAVTIKSSEGLEVLIHVGIDTVTLGGEGFYAHVHEGQAVKVGDLLLSFDDAALLAGAASLCTPIVFLGEGAIERHAPDATLINETDALFTIYPSHATRDTPESVDQSSAALTQDLIVDTPEGLHARPSAELAASITLLAGRFSLLLPDGLEANAKSVTELMSLGVRRGDRVTVRASGQDAEQGLALIASQLNGLGDNRSPEHSTVTVAESNPARKGVVASPGLLVAPMALYSPDEGGVSAISALGDQGLEGFDNAIADYIAELEGRSSAAGEVEASILRAHIALLRDPALVDVTHAAIGRGVAADRAWLAAIDAQSEAFRASGDERLRGRIVDLQELGREIVRRMSGHDPQDSADVNGKIVVAEDLAPGEFLNLVSRGAQGICLTKGGATSHVAILASSLEVPALVAVGGDLPPPFDGPVIIDTSDKLVNFCPSSELIESVTTKIARRAAMQKSALANLAVPAVTTDGIRVSVNLNVNVPTDADQALVAGLHECGLMRTEFLFADRRTPPSVEEQIESYRGICKKLDGGTVTFRLLDVGGDKAFPYLELPREENPALGLRGIRALFANESVLLTQVQALLRTSQNYPVRIKAPMINDLTEFRRFAAVVAHEAGRLGVAKLPQLGCMIETPACALVVDQLATEADFFSIGTNDLTQYLLAMDRGNTDLAADLDALHPAMLRLVSQISAVGGAARKEVCVCGGAAADPLAIPMLLGLGIQRLSVPPSMLAPVSQIIRELSVEESTRVASAAKELTSAAEVRALILRHSPWLSEWQ